MAKKTVKQSRASFERTLKNAIRRRSAQKNAFLFDDAVPEVLRAHTQTPSTHPSIHTEKPAHLSPHILALRSAHDATKLLIEHESCVDFKINFLSEASFQSPISIPDTSNDLLLTKEELKKQQTKTGSSTVPLLFTPFRFALNRITKPNIHPECTPLRIQKQTTLSAHTFNPKPVPENILEYFDLPEEEGGKEEEQLVDLESLLAPDKIQVFPEEKKAKKPWFPTIDLFILPTGWQKTIAVFVLFSFAFVLPIHAMHLINQLRDAKQNAQTNGLSALQSLKNASQTNLVKNPNAARTQFNQAEMEFGKAKKQIDDLGSNVSLLLSSLAPTKKTFKTNTALLTIGSELSIAGSRISDGFEAMSRQTNPTPTSYIELLELHLGAALPHLVAAHQAMSDVDLEIIDPSQRDVYQELVAALPSLISSAQDFLSLSETLNTILGAHGTKHYLLVFQNNTEIRPTGGFMGSFAEIKMHNGVMEAFTVPGGGTYDLQGQQREPYVSPWPLQLLSPKWEFQDANWFPDFRTSARQIIAFYKNSRQADVDGVIAINASYVEDLIQFLGPIDMPEYDRVIDAENFIAETQKIVEHEYDKTENKPKAFIGALAPKLIEKALSGSPDTFLSLANHLNKGLSEKNIQLYFKEETAEKNILSRGWGGEIKQTEKDYLMIANTNLGGGKTDATMKEDVRVDVQIAHDGTITNTVTIARTHEGDPNDPFTGVHNVNYQRLYVPKGSRLIHAEGFEIPDGNLFEKPSDEWIVDTDLQFADASFTLHEKSGTQTYEEEGKTVFGNWTQTNVGETTVTSFTYTLPFTLSSLFVDEPIVKPFKEWIGIPTTESYSILLQKQSGVLHRETTIHLSIPSSMNPVWSSSDPNQTSVNNTFDHLFSILFESAL